MAKIYRHYKKKLYTYLGEARHSETLEALVLYNTRYDTEYGNLWVRPKELFFSEIELNGQTRPRFEKLAIEYRAQTSGDFYETLRPLLDSVFGGYAEAKFAEKLAGRKNVLLLTAWFEGELLGFKLGYGLDAKRFYGWLGAVAEKYRGGGVATDLLYRQEDWCRTQGFSVIHTRTKNQWREMLLLNIKNGFVIKAVGEDGKIHLEKDLLAL